MEKKSIRGIELRQDKVGRWFAEDFGERPGHVRVLSWQQLRALRDEGHPAAEPAEHLGGPE